MEDDLSSWIVDLGVTNHVCSSLQMLSSFRELADEDFTMRMGNNSVVSGKVVGEVRLQFRNNKFLVLNKFYYIPGFRRNFISVSVLFEQSYQVKFNGTSVFISKNGLDICTGRLDSGLYMIRSKSNLLLSTELFKVEQP